MAKLSKTIELHVGDFIQFKVSPTEPSIQGRIQDITEFPEIWVEVGDPRMKWPKYNRYHISPKMIEYNMSNYEWEDEYVEFDKDELKSFVYNEKYERIYS